MSASCGVVMSIVCTEPDELRFCRRLSADVNQGPLFLASVLVTGRQVYPFHDPLLGNPDSLMRCEFRLRDVSAVISHQHIQDLCKRLDNYCVIEAHTIDQVGLTIDRVSLPLTVGP